MKGGDIAGGPGKVEGGGTVRCRGKEGVGVGWADSCFWHSPVLWALCVIRCMWTRGPRPGGRGSGRRFGERLDPCFFSGQHHFLRFTTKGQLTTGPESKYLGFVEHTTSVANT